MSNHKHDIILLVISSIDFGLFLMASEHYLSGGYINLSGWLLGVAIIIAAIIVLRLKEIFQEG